MKTKEELITLLNKSNTKFDIAWAIDNFPELWRDCLDHARSPRYSIFLTKSAKELKELKLQCLNKLMEATK